MKCPKCELLTSDGKDECPRCQLDFRPYKERLGIQAPTRPTSKNTSPSSSKPASAPELPFEYFDEESEVEQARPKLRQPQKIDLSDLIAGIEELRLDEDQPDTATQHTSQDVGDLQDLIEAIGTMGPDIDNGDLSNSNLEALEPDAQQLFTSMQQSQDSSTIAAACGAQELASEESVFPNLEDLGSSGLELFGDSLGTAQEPSAEIAAVTTNDLSHMLEDVEQSEGTALDDEALFAELASALESTVAEANDATSSLQTMPFPEKVADAPAETLRKKAKNPHSSAPAVLEFGDDDDLLEQQLDAMLGDEELDVQAVKIEKVQTFQNDADHSSMFLEDDLEISFEVEIDDDDEELDAAPVESNETSEGDEGLLGGLLKSFDELEAGTEQKDVVSRKEETLPESPALEELTSLLNSTTTDDSDDELSALQAELENELAALETEGTSFLADANFDATKLEEAAEEEEEFDDELAALSKELGVELDALSDEGTNFLSTTADNSDEEDKLNDELSELSAELGQELDALQEEGSSFLTETEVTNELENPSLVEESFELRHDLSNADPLEKALVEERVSENEELSDALSDLLALEQTLAEDKDDGAVLDDLDFDAAPADTFDTELLAEDSFEEESLDELESTNADETPQAIVDASQTGIFLASDFSAILGDLDEEEESDEPIEKEESLDLATEETQELCDVSQADSFPNEDLASGIEETDTEEPGELDSFEIEDELSQDIPEEEPSVDEMSQTGAFFVSDLQNLVETEEELDSEQELSTAIPEETEALDETSQTGIFLSSDLQSIIQEAEDFAETIEDAPDVEGEDKEVPYEEEQLWGIEKQTPLEEPALVSEQDEEIANLEIPEETQALDETSQTGIFLTSDLQSIIDEVEDYAETIEDADDVEEDIAEDPYEEEQLWSIEEATLTEKPELDLGEDEQDSVSELAGLTEAFDESSQTGAFLASDLQNLAEEENELDAEQKGVEPSTEKDQEHVLAPDETPQSSIPEETQALEDASQTGIFLAADLQKLIEHPEEQDTPNFDEPNDEIEQAPDEQVQTLENLSFDKVRIGDSIFEVVPEDEMSPAIEAGKGLEKSSFFKRIFGRKVREVEEQLDDVVDTEGEDEPSLEVTTELSEGRIESDAESMRADTEQVPLAEKPEVTLADEEETEDNKAVSGSYLRRFFGRREENYNEEERVDEVENPETLENEVLVYGPDNLETVQSNNAAEKMERQGKQGPTPFAGISPNIPRKGSDPVFPVFPFCPESVDTEEDHSSETLVVERSDALGIYFGAALLDSISLRPRWEEPEVLDETVETVEDEQEVEFSETEDVVLDESPAETTATYEDDDDVGTDEDNFFDDDEEEIGFSSEDISFTPEEDEEEEEELLCSEEPAPEAKPESNSDEINIADIRSLFSSGDDPEVEDEIVPELKKVVSKPEIDKPQVQVQAKQSYHNLNIAPELWDAASSELLASAEQSEEFEISVHEMMGFNRSDKLDLLFDLVQEEIENPEKRRRHKVTLADSNTRVLENNHIEKAVVRYANDQKKLREIQAEIDENGMEEFSIPIEGATSLTRLYAFGLDAALCLALSIVFSMAAFLPASTTQAILSLEAISTRELLPHFFDMLLLFYGFWIGLNSTFIALSGQTFGCRICKIEVMNSRGFPVSFAQALVHCMLQIPNALLLGIGSLQSWNGNRQSLPDVLANTQTGTRLFDMEMSD